MTQYIFLFRIKKEKIKNKKIRDYKKSSVLSNCINSTYILNLPIRLLIPSIESLVLRARSETFCVALEIC